MSPLLLSVRVFFFYPLTHVCHHHPYNLALCCPLVRVHCLRVIEIFGGLYGVRDKSAVEAAVFRPQTSYYTSIEEEAAALMESLVNNQGFLDGNKRIAFTAADVFLRTLRSKARTDTHLSLAR